MNIQHISDQAQMQGNQEHQEAPNQHRRAMAFYRSAIMNTLSGSPEDKCKTRPMKGKGETKTASAEPVPESKYGARLDERIDAKCKWNNPGPPPVPITNSTQTNSPRQKIVRTGRPSPRTSEMPGKVHVPELPPGTAPSRSCLRKLAFGN